MGLAQMGALSGGQRFKRPYVEEINARTPYLPQLYAQKKTDEYNDKMYGLKEKELAQDREFGLKNLSMMEDAQSEMKKRNKLARNMGYANIGIGTALGAMDNWDSIKSGISSISSMFPSVSEGEGLQSVFGNVAREASSAPFEVMSSGGGGPLDWIDYVSPSVRNLAGGAWDVGKGIFDSVVGDAVDFDWDWSDAFSADSSDFDWDWSDAF